MALGPEERACSRSKKRRILITGAQGMLGTELVRALAGHDLRPVDLADGDLTDRNAALRLVWDTGVDFAIHTAAMTDVDGCERDPDRAWRHNTLATWNLADACSSRQVPLVYLSTDFVFDGEKRAPYHEFDRPNPLGVYGASKLGGETVVRQLCPQHYIVRTAWLFGKTGKNFVRTILARAAEGKPLSVVADQVGSPTYAADLADAIARHIVDTYPLTLCGTYHITNAGQASWAELARATVQAAGAACEVREISSADWPSPTRRPAYSVLDHLALRMQGRDDLRPWQEAVAEAVRGMQSG